MAKKKSESKPDSFQPIRRKLTHYVDATRRLFSTVERYDVRFTSEPVEGVNWNWLADFARQNFVAALVGVEEAVDALRDELSTSSTSLPTEWHQLLDTACRITKWACDDARSDGWFDGRRGVSGIKGRHELMKLRFSSGLATTVLDSIEAALLPPTQRLILKALLQCPSLTGDELAKEAVGLKSTNSGFRAVICELVNAGLLFSGGKGSRCGYRLTDRGIMLATNVLTISGFLN